MIGQCAQCSKLLGELREAYEKYVALRVSLWERDAFPKLPAKDVRALKAVASRLDAAIARVTEGAAPVSPRVGCGKIPYGRHGRTVVALALSLLAASSELTASPITTPPYDGPHPPLAATSSVSITRDVPSPSATPKGGLSEPKRKARSGAVQYRTRDRACRKEG